MSGMDSKGTQKCNQTQWSKNRLPEIRWTRRTCPANFENVRRRAPRSPDKMSSEEKMNLCLPVILSLKMSDESLKCPAKNIQIKIPLMPIVDLSISAWVQDGCYLINVMICIVTRSFSTKIKSRSTASAQLFNTDKHLGLIMTLLCSLLHSAKLRL